MVMGLLLAAVSGAVVGLQNIFNTKVNEHASGWMTSTLVLGLGFVSSFMFGLAFEGGGLFALDGVQVWHLFVGWLGIGVVICVVQSIQRLGPTLAIAISLVSQLIFALACDGFGWFGMDKLAISPKQLIGVALAIGGILLFKLGGRQQEKKEGRV